MRDIGLVTEIQSNNEIVITPLLKDVCLGCTSTCAKKGKSFTVTNPQNLKIQIGSKAKIGAPIFHQIMQALVNFCVPIGLTILTYFLLLNYTNLPVGLIAGISLATLFTLCAIILIISQRIPLTKGEITEVLDSKQTVFTVHKKCKFHM